MKKDKKAVALEYDLEKDKAPRVTAKGKGLIAERIIKIAKEKGIPIKEDPDLADMLYKVRINEEIPPYLYRVVAEILAFIYKTKRKWKESLGKSI